MIIGANGHVDPETSGETLTQAAQNLGVTKTRFGQLLLIGDRSNTAALMNGRRGTSQMYLNRLVHIFILLNKDQFDPSEFPKQAEAFFTSKGLV